MLQSTVLGTMGTGSAGDIVKGTHSYFNSIQRVVVDDTTSVGEFVQSNGTANECIGASGKAITGNILGVVVKNELRSNGETILCEEGKPTTILETGNILIETSSIVAQDDYVFLKTADGELGFASTKTLADHTYTGFRVEVGNATATKGVIEITTSRA